MSFLGPSQILELNIISAQDLAPVARYMKTYAIAWLDPERKLTTRVDNTGGTSPTWNDKFVFRLDEESLYDETSLVVIEIYALHWFKDIHVGTVQALVSDLVNHVSAMRFVTLEVLRASGRPHGLLNIAVGLIDSSRQSVPLYTPSLFEQDLMFHQKKTLSTKPEVVGLRRSKSETSSMVESELSRMMKRRNSAKNVGIEEGIVDRNPTSNSISSSSDKNEFSSDSQMVVYHPPNKTPMTASKPKHVVHGTPMRPRNISYVPKKNNVEYGTPMRKRPAVVITESELGPSASVVAAQIAKERAMTGKEVESTVISVGERSVEGLQSKLERWQANLPPVLDAGSSYQASSDYKKSSNYKPTSNYQPNEITGGGGRTGKHPMAIEPVKKHTRRHTDGGNSGLFSCFSNICGIECSIVCGGGGGGAKGSKQKKRQK
ncbi:PREDICTED: uncharacterized protein LOC104809022 isoform X2 [Tarenaya hassleriana]|uniref:uncharacterized protein LOC104809022 isoform X1 n=1 Tax=Tarenaya hassleriana TaxID=28532 RepID=UPI00053C7D6F|nr:PREDICTED: uncharacterized protein LOC104809022 isoform X1 [Tarenaya hassleriana]XP_010533204.1 PREDICTED: uncharacterized protein LOC104809022 isoform X2 [Tarenaya hassleriana]